MKKLFLLLPLAYLWAVAYGFYLFPIGKPFEFWWNFPLVMTILAGFVILFVYSIAKATD